MKIKHLRDHWNTVIIRDNGKTAYVCSGTDIDGAEYWKWWPSESASLRGCCDQLDGLALAAAYVGTP